MDYGFVLTGDSQSTSGTRSLAYMGSITGDSQNTSGTRGLAHVGGITGDGQNTRGTRSLAYMGSITGDSQNTSSTRSLNTNLGIGNNISNTMGMSSTSNPGLGSNLSNTMGMSSTNNLGLGSNISNTMGMSSTNNPGLGNNIANMMGSSSSSNLGIGSNMSNMLGSSSMSNLGLGSNMNNQAASFTLAGDGQGASSTSSLGSNMSSLDFSRQIVGKGQNTSGTSRLSFNDKTGASVGDMARGVEGASGLIRDGFTSRGYHAFSPFNYALQAKSLLQINLGQSAIGLMDVINLGSLTNFSRKMFFFSSNRDSRYHYEKQPHFSDEVASSSFPSVYAGNSVPQYAHLDKLNYPILFSPLHQNGIIITVDEQDTNVLTRNIVKVNDSKSGFKRDSLTERGIIAFLSYNTTYAAIPKSKESMDRVLSLRWKYSIWRC